MNLLLVRRFPSLADGYLGIKRMWGGDEPGPHVVYGDVLVPEIRAVLAAEPTGERLRAITDFLEELSTIADNDVLDVLVTTVLEGLLDDPNRDGFEQCLGPRTKRLWRRLVVDSD